MPEDIIAAPPNLRLSVEKRSSPAGLEITFRLKSDHQCLLHWGLAGQRPGSWQIPPEKLWPGGTQAFNTAAVQTPFVKQNGEHRITIRLSESLKTPFLVFDLFCPQTGRWENNQGKDYYVPLDAIEPAVPPLAALLDGQLKNVEVVHRKVLRLDSEDELVAAVTQRSGRYQVSLLTNADGPLLLHWGLIERARAEWRLPPETVRPPGSTVFNDHAVDTPFEQWQQCRRLILDFPETQAPAGLCFVLHQPAAGRWLKHRGQDLFIPIAKPPETPGQLSTLAGEIVRAEVGDHGWTLMHRFNLCYDLVDAVRGQRDGWATLFVWLRFSAIRQLDWQRNYNTKPRELAHAQDRLTLKLAEAYIHEPAQRDLIRLMFACLGRGGEGQRIRDDILQIMHRHRIKEVGGTWLEQWHQKLHNNTTPDDIVICEAYLAFLRSNGNFNSYFETLTTGGVTQERLASFDRPINANPEWHPQLKDALIHDFENFLRLLKSVHSGTDLESAANTGGYLLEGAARDALGYVQQHFHIESSPPETLAQRFTEVRRHLNRLLQQETSPVRVRDALYLDLALEDTLRVIIERATHSGFAGGQLVELIACTLENMLLVQDDAELAQCHREWLQLPARDRFNPDWSLHAKAALDRLRRAIEAGIDRTYQLLQPKAESLGRAFHAEAWSVQMFSEAVARGRVAFVLSMLVRDLDPILRRKARLGDWQVISPSHATGEVLAIESLRQLQGRRFERQTVIVAEKVFGDEEPPEGVCAVITPSSVDLVSHVAVRARNARLLFATCYDRACFDKLKTMQGRVLQLQVTPAGDVLFEELAAAPLAAAPRPAARLARVTLPRPAAVHPIRPRDFKPGVVGDKSCHLKELAGKLPNWIRTPRSVALPFGAFDVALYHDANRPVAARYHELLPQIGLKPSDKLAEIRRCLLELQLPENLPNDLRRTMHAEGLPWPEDWPAAAQRIKQVWASKWNERAYFSRLARGFPHEDMFMAVLIQEVVEADYAFVIHTVNPFTGNRDELYAEVVPGLGETLVGNYPGRALSFVSPIAKPAPALLTYPSKSVGLYGGGLIFRSDSNAEDLAGYAGAGLYDSVLLTPPQQRTLDYTRDLLVSDTKFRAEFLATITRIGALVQAAFGLPQDIEGAYSGGRFHVVQTRPQVGLKA